MIRTTIETDDMKATVEEPNAFTLTDALLLFSGAIRAVGYSYKGEIIIEDDYE